MYVRRDETPPRPAIAEAVTLSNARGNIHDSCVLNVSLCRLIAPARKEEDYGRVSPARLRICSNSSCSSDIVFHKVQRDRGENAGDLKRHGNSKWDWALGKSDQRKDLSASVKLNRETDVITDERSR